MRHCVRACMKSTFADICSQHLDDKYAYTSLKTMTVMALGMEMQILSKRHIGIHRPCPNVVAELKKQLSTCEV